MEICPVCNLAVSPEQVLPPQSVDESTRRLLAVNARGWDPEKGICESCLAHMKRAADELAARFPEFDAQKLKILPTPLRLNAPDEFRGRGITIAFLDSGFYAHPDLTQPNNRILSYVNLTGQGPSDLSKPDVSSWHGMMTSVVGAGNGFLSGGLYRGIASEAELVLIKVGSASRVRHEDIALGLSWVIDNRERFNIGIVNISTGGDYEASYLEDPLSRVAEDAARAGIVVVAAAGNAGDRETHPVLPPASVPSVITVGGLDDRNTLDLSDNLMYHSSYGPTIDGLQKPEVIAPGIWLAAPILPGTVTAEQAALLSALEAAGDSDLKTIIEGHPGLDAELDHAVDLDPYLIRHLVWIKERDNNVISGNYKHVDGTSFAAPIVSSIAAQMLEANPALKPHQVKLALIRTAVRLPNVDVDKQGWGMVNPRAAVQAALATSGGAVKDSRDFLAPAIV
jgi:serine protease AprX